MDQTESIIIRQYTPKDIPELIRIWNQVVEDGVAFPQEECLTIQTGTEFFANQTYTAAAVGELLEMDFSSVAALTAGNAAALFGLATQ